MDEENPLSERGARIVGDNGPVDDKFWFRSGLSLITKNPISPRAYLEEQELNCIPASEITTGDLVIFFKGGQLFKKRAPNGTPVIDTSKVDLIRFGVAYTDAADQIRVISQDGVGKVWDHPLDQLPGYDKDDWDYYGLHLQYENPLEDFRGRNQVSPLDVIETWMAKK